VPVHRPTTAPACDCLPENIGQYNRGAIKVKQHAQRMPVKISLDVFPSRPSPRMTGYLPATVGSINPAMAARVSHADVGCLVSLSG